MFTLRQAKRTDAAVIRAMVNREHLNPFNLNWEHFIVAESDQGQVVGCGQVKTHFDGSRELASIVVAPDWRRGGVATAMIEHLLEAHPGELYLTCGSALGEYYQRFGFRVLAEADMPPYFRRLSRLVNWPLRLLHRADILLVMKRLEQENP